MPRQKGQHTWMKINASQHRCTVCGIVKTAKFDTKQYKNVTTYQDNESKVHQEYVPCIEKYDDSEFYK